MKRRNLHSVVHQNGSYWHIADIRSLPPDVRFWGKADIATVSKYHLRLSPSRKAIASSSTRTASSMGMTGRASNTKAGSIEQNL